VIFGGGDAERCDAEERRIDVSRDDQARRDEERDT